MVTTEQIVRNELASVKAEGYVFSDTDLELVDKVVSGEMSIEEAVQYLKGEYDVNKKRKADNKRTV